jgi:hypothetical protein
MQERLQCLKTINEGAHVQGLDRRQEAQRNETGLVYRRILGGDEDDDYLW